MRRIGWIVAWHVHRSFWSWRAACSRRPQRQRGNPARRPRQTSRPAIRRPSSRRSPPVERSAGAAGAAGNAGTAAYPDHNW